MCVFSYVLSDTASSGINTYLHTLPLHDALPLFLKRISAILAAVEPDMPDLGAEERAGRLVFVSLGGSSMDLWITTLEGLDRREFYLTDRDQADWKSTRLNSSH